MPVLFRVNNIKDFSRYNCRFYQEKYCRLVHRAGESPRRDYRHRANPLTEKCCTQLRLPAARARSVIFPPEALLLPLFLTNRDAQTFCCFNFVSGPNRDQLGVNMRWRGCSDLAHGPPHLAGATLRRRRSDPRVGERLTPTLLNTG